MRIEGTDESGFDLVVCKRLGDYAGRPNNGSDINSNSIPRIDPCGAVRDMEIRIFGKAPTAVCVNGESITFDSFDGGISFVLAAKEHEAGDVRYEIEY